jgi:threonine/homoserine/homoserine lactone efflux protein
VWVFWMSVVVSFTANYKGDFADLIRFFPSALVTILFMDILKSFSAYKIKRYLQSHSILWVNRIAGIGLIIFGIYLMARTLLEDLAGLGIR